MKTRIDVIASEESYQNLSSFSDIEELNKTIRTYRDIIRASIKRADVQARLIALLELLKRHSCKQIGVSYMCKNTIADKLELSYKTVQRLMKKLEDLGMIRQVSMKRKKDMLQTANAIIIVPAENMSDKTTAKSPAKCPTIKTTPVFLKQKIKRLNTRNNSVSSTDNVDKSADNFSKANFIAHWVPERFANLANCFFHEAKTIQELWKVVRQNNRIVNHWDNLRAFNADQELSIGLTSLKEFVMKVKSGKRIKNIFGYFNGIVDNIMDKLIFDEDFMEE
jgi:DNA-binding Lrp family transcriptional regulator